MTAFRVWAPRADRVDLALGGQRVSMAPEVRGWWRAETAARAGTDYAFSVDGGPPLPDPRSPWQPQGIHGPSRTVDHSAFRWKDEDWRPPSLQDAIFYELHVGTFTAEGTFETAVAKLDHLVRLGVTHVELMPVAEFSGGQGWGYDGVDLFAPHHAYGAPDDLKWLVEACHRRGLAVVLDVVYNHLGPAGNYLAQFGPYFTDRYATPWGEVVNFDGPHSDEVRRFVCDNALMWLRDYHFDGLRLDAIHAIYDFSATHILEQLAEEVHRLGDELGRKKLLVAESDLNDPRIVSPPEVGGYGVDAQWSDDFHHALHAALTGERAGYYDDFGRLEHLAAAFTRAFVYDGRYSRFRQRRHGRPIGGLTGDKFLAYAQNHDQVGNRAHGERLSHLVDADQLKIAAALVLTSPFLPLLFQGEEWGALTPFFYFTGHDDPELARAVRSGRRAEFPAFHDHREIPDPQAETTFLQSKLTWNEISDPRHADLHDWYRALIQLRHRAPELTDGRLDRVDARFDEDNLWFAVRRAPYVVVCNLADHAQRIAIFDLEPAEIMLASRTGISLANRGMHLPPRSVAILREAI